MKLRILFKWLDAIGQNYNKRQEVLENTLITIHEFLKQENNEELCDMCRIKIIPGFYSCLIQKMDANKFVHAMKFSLIFSLDHLVLKNKMDKYVEMRKIDLAFLQHFWSEADTDEKKELKEGIQSVIQEYHKITGDTKLFRETKSIFDS